MRQVFLILWWFMKTLLPSSGGEGDFMSEPTGDLFKKYINRRIGPKDFKEK